MIHLDTNFLIAGLIAGTPEDAQIRRWLTAEPINISTIAWSEFLCGPLDPVQEAAAAALFPSPEPFVAVDARAAADLFNRTGRRRGSLADCMIAAVALRVGATLATSNISDFRRFVPLGLRLARPLSRRNGR